MIKKNNCFIYPGNRGNNTHTETTQKADKIKACILYQAKPKQPPKQEKTL